MKTLKLWQRSDNYLGEEYNDYYVVLGRNRDSDILTNSNFDIALERLGGECDDKVRVIRNGHWACGWIEFIAVHKDDLKHVTIAQQIVNDIEKYPVLDDDDYYKRECEAILYNIKDSLYQVRDIDNIPEVTDIYSYFSTSGQDMTEEFYPDREQLLEAIEDINKQQALDKQLQAGQTVMEIV